MANRIPEGSDPSADGSRDLPENQRLPDVPKTAGMSRTKVESVLSTGVLSPEKREEITLILHGLDAQPISIQQFEESQGGIKMTHKNDSTLLLALSGALNKAEADPEKLLPQVCTLAGLIMAAWNNFEIHKTLGDACNKITPDDLIGIARTIHAMKTAAKPNTDTPSTAKKRQTGIHEVTEMAAKAAEIRGTPASTPPTSSETNKPTTGTGRIRALSDKSGVFSVKDIAPMISHADTLRDQREDIAPPKKTIEEVPKTISLAIDEMTDFQKKLLRDEAIDPTSRQTLSISIQYCLGMMQRIIKRMLAAEPKEYEMLKGRANRALIPLKEIKRIIEVLQTKAHQNRQFRVIVVTDGIVSQISALRAIAEGIRLGVKNGGPVNDDPTNEQQIDGVSAAFGLNHATDKVILTRMKQLFESAEKTFPAQMGNILAAEGLIGFMLETPLNKTGEAYQQWTLQMLVESAGLLAGINLENESLEFFIDQAGKTPHEKKFAYRNLVNDDLIRLQALQNALQVLEKASKREENQTGSNRIDMRQAKNFAASLIAYLTLVPPQERDTPPFHGSFQNLLGHLEAVARGTETVMDASTTTDYMRQLELTVRTKSDEEFDKVSDAEKARLAAETLRDLEAKKGAILGEEGAVADELGDAFDALEEEGS